MNRSCSRTLFIYLGADSFPILKGDIESVVAYDEKQAKRHVLDAKGFSNVIVFRLVKSIDGVYVRLPFGQKTGFLNSMLDYLKKSGFEVGAYSLHEDSSFYRFVYTDVYGPKKTNVKIYEIVAPSIDSLKLCYCFLKKHFGDKQ
jgi:hypothetical protein